MKKFFISLSLMTIYLFAEPNAQGINEILSKSLDRLEQNKKQEQKKNKDLDSMLNILDNQEKILNLFKITFFLKKVTPSGKIEKSIFVTDKNNQEVFVELKEGSRFGFFTIEEIQDTYVSFTIKDNLKLYTKSYIISSSKNRFGKDK